MNKNVQAWIDALRSGKYKQAQSFLRTPEGYCCLGVACDLYANIEGKGEWTQYEKSYVFDPKDGHPSGTYLPQALHYWLGHLPAKFEERLADANDSGRSFEEIADMIEAGLSEKAASSD